MSILGQESNLRLEQFKEHISMLFNNKNNFNEAVYDMFKIIREYLKSDVVFIDYYDGVNFVRKHEWIKDVNFKTNQILNSKFSSYIFDVFKDQEYVKINTLKDLNNKSLELKSYLNLLNVKSLCLFPIKILNQTIGCIGVIYYNKLKKINYDHVELLSAFSKLISDNYQKELSENYTKHLLTVHKQYLNKFIYPFVLIDQNYKIIDTNEKFQKLFNINKNELLDKDFIEYFSNYDRENMELVFKDCVNDVRSDIEIFKLINNEKKIFKITPFPIITEQFNLFGIVIKDITKYRTEETKLKKMAFFDSTTGLHNRNYFEYICDEIKNLDFNQIGIMVLDIDNLKIVNDKYGHEQGDNIIVNISRLLYEIFNKEYLVARIGGDEFVVFILNRQEYEITTLIDAFKSKINYHNRYNEIQLNLSIGYAYKDNNKIDILDLLNKADENMYLNKKKKSIIF